MRLQIALFSVFSTSLWCLPSEEEEFIDFVTAWMPEDAESVWTPRMATLKLLLDQENPNPTTILPLVNSQCPDTPWTVENVAMTIQSVRLATSVPRWFHETIWSFGPEVDAANPEVIDALMHAATLPENGADRSRVFGTRHIVSYIANHWIVYCVRLLHLFPGGEFCRPTKSIWMLREIDAWILTPNQRRSFVEDLIVQAHAAQVAAEDIRVPDIDFDDLFPPLPGLI